MSKRTEVTCNGQMLTVHFSTATPSLIWRFDLERNHSFTLSLQGEEGDWELGVTSPQGDFYPVAHFAAREDAEEAMIKVGKSLSRTSKGAGSGSRMLRALLIFCVLVGCVVLVVIGVGFWAGHPSPQLSSALSPSPMVQEGVPMSADDVLKPPR